MRRSITSDTTWQVPLCRSASVARPRQRYQSALRRMVSEACVNVLFCENKTLEKLNRTWTLRRVSPNNLKVIYRELQ